VLLTGKYRNVLWITCWMANALIPFGNYTFFSLHPGNELVIMAPFFATAKQYQLTQQLVNTLPE